MATLNLHADTPAAVLQHWFGDSDPCAALTARDPADVALLEQRMAAWPEPPPALACEVDTDLVWRARQGALDAWQTSAPGRLALVIVLHGHTRLAYAGTARAFENDTRAISACLEALASGADRTLALHYRAGLLLPLLHSELVEDVNRALAALVAMGTETPPLWRRRVTSLIDRARQRRDVLERFGRFPDRNDALGRTSTEEELSFLAAQARQEPAQSSTPR